MEVEIARDLGKGQVHAGEGGTEVKIAVTEDGVDAHVDSKFWGSCRRQRRVVAG